MELQWGHSLLLNIWNSLLQDTFYNLEVYKIPQKRNERYFSLQ